MAGSSGLVVAKATRMLRFALDKASRFLRDKVAQQSQHTVEAHVEPVYARISRASRLPIHRVAAIKQSQSRWYSTKQAIGRSIRNYSSEARAASRTVAALGRASTRTPFASQLRPNLTGGTLSRTAGGYAYGSGRVGGVRHFSHSPAAPAEVINNVSQAVRAFWLSGSRARFDGFNERAGEKKFRLVSQTQDNARHSMDVARMKAQATGSFIDFKVTPTITALGPLASIPRSSAVRDCETDSLNNPVLMSSLAVDFARALKDLAAIMNDLKHLATLGDLPLSLEDSHTLRVRFPGCDLDTVEALCTELNICRGTVGQDEDFDAANGTEMALLFPFAPSKTPSESMYDISATKAARMRNKSMRDHIDWQAMLSPAHTPSPNLSHRSETSELDMVDELVDNPWSPSGYSSLHLSDVQDDAEARYFAEWPGKTAKGAYPAAQHTGYEGFEGIYHFLEQCDSAARRATSRPSYRPVLKHSMSPSSTTRCSVGIFLPPGRDPNHPSNYIYQLGRIARLLFHCGFAVSWRIVASFPAQVKEMKSAVFTPQQVAELDFYYVFFLGTRPEAQGQGLASAWLRQCQAEAARAGKPIWLESSTVRSRDLYAHLGWRVVAEQVFGKGLVDAQGRPVEGGRGEGATLWGMIWWPEGLDPSAKTGSGGGKNDSDAK
ncbi:hypothetical protein DV738_g2868, partial [Chaetothyriales sp. CBS 135597]